MRLQMRLNPNRPKHLAYAADLMANNLSLIAISAPRNISALELITYFVECEFKNPLNPAAGISLILRAWNPDFSCSPEFISKKMVRKGQDLYKVAHLMLSKV